MRDSPPMRVQLRRAVNALLGPVDLRVVNARWGPRGPMDSLRRVRARGVVPRQIVDVGASDGCWTRECLQVFPEARYFLIDPLPSNVPALTALQVKHPHLQVWHGALGGRPGVLDLRVHGDQSSFLFSDRFDTGTSISVEVRSLDSFLDTALLQPPEFIKVDVQGFELEVLKGADACLKSAALLLLEVSYRRIYRNLPLAHEVIAYAGGKGFRVYDICTYVGRPSDGELTQSDILFAPEGSPLFADET